jgi:mxaK protein
MIPATVSYLYQRWRSLRSTVIAGAAFALVFVTFVALDQWRRVAESNDRISALAQGHDIDIGPNERPELLLARIAFLTTRGDLDRSRILLEALDHGNSPALRARGHYLRANGLLRKALDQIEASQIDAATPFINLAKKEYRRALELSPDDWDAKFNFDVAARFVRDFPEYEKNAGDELAADPKKLWTDVPGKPKGLP